MGRMTSMWATNTISTATPRSPFQPGTLPNVRTSTATREQLHDPSGWA